MEDEKAEKISISLPTAVLNAVELHLRNINEGNRSNWFCGLASKELEKEGMLPGNPRAEINGAVDELGEEKALDILRRACRRKGAQVRTLAA